MTLRILKLPRISLCHGRGPLGVFDVGEGFDRNTLEHVRNNPDLTVTGTRFVKHDTYLIIQGGRNKCPAPSETGYNLDRHRGRQSA